MAKKKKATSKPAGVRQNGQLKKGYRYDSRGRVVPAKAKRRKK